MEEQEPQKPNFEIPSEFKKVIVDMTKDILVSFPEQEANLHQELKNLVFEYLSSKWISFQYLYL